ncbi:MAG: hypothetical protein QOD25_1960 [Alphaproteobacteria bacterium]|jgi:hypothetical protein|nr:hypothetical protein [Alphaproteobacteria bacterium]
MSQRPCPISAYRGTRPHLAAESKAHPMSPVEAAVESERGFAVEGGTTGSD